MAINTTLRNETHEKEISGTEIGVVAGNSMFACIIVFGNLLTIGTVLNKKARGTASTSKIHCRIYIASLAFADFLSGFITATIVSLAVFEKAHTPAADVYCRYIRNVVEVATLVSQYHLLIISIDRLYSVLKPVGYRYSILKTRAKTVSGLLWLLSVVETVTLHIALTTNQQSKIKSHNEMKEEGVCRSNNVYGNNTRLYYIWCLSQFSLFFFSVSAIYVIIIRHLRNHDRHMSIWKRGKGDKFRPENLSTQERMSSDTCPNICTCTSSTEEANGRDDPKISIISSHHLLKIPPSVNYSSDHAEEPPSVNYSSGHAEEQCQADSIAVLLNTAQITGLPDASSEQTKGVIGSDHEALADQEINHIIYMFHRSSFRWYPVLQTINEQPPIDAPPMLSQTTDFNNYIDNIVNIRKKQRNQGKPISDSDGSLSIDKTREQGSPGSDTTLSIEQTQPEESAGPADSDNDLKINKQGKPMSDSDESLTIDNAREQESPSIDTKLSIEQTQPGKESDDLADSNNDLKIDKQKSPRHADNDIAIKLDKIRKEEAAASGSDAKQKRETLGIHQKVIVTFIVVILAFAISNLPYMVHIAWFVVTGDYLPRPMLYIAASTLYFGAAVNPLIYSKMLPGFYTSVLYYLRKCHR